MRSVISEQLMIQDEQSKITRDVNITPSEVKNFFKKLPKDSIPEIGSEMQIGIIAKVPVIGEAEKREVKEKLVGMKERIKKGMISPHLQYFIPRIPALRKKVGNLECLKGEKCALNSKPPHSN